MDSAKRHSAHIESLGESRFGICKSFGESRHRVIRPFEIRHIPISNHSVNWDSNNFGESSITFLPILRHKISMLYLSRTIIQINCNIYTYLCKARITRAVSVLHNRSSSSTGHIYTHIRLSWIHTIRHIPLGGRDVRALSSFMCHPEQIYSCVWSAKRTICCACPFYAVAVRHEMSPHVKQIKLFHLVKLYFYIKWYI